MLLLPLLSLLLALRFLLALNVSLSSHFLLPSLLLGALLSLLLLELLLSCLFLRTLLRLLFLLPLYGLLLLQLLLTLGFLLLPKLSLSLRFLLLLLALRLLLLAKLSLSLRFLLLPLLRLLLLRLLLTLLGLRLLAGLLLARVRVSASTERQSWYADDQQEHGDTPFGTHETFPWISSCVDGSANPLGRIGSGPRLAVQHSGRSYTTNEFSLLTAPRHKERQHAG